MLHKWISNSDKINTFFFFPRSWMFGSVKHGMNFELWYFSPLPFFFFFWSRLENKKNQDSEIQHAKREPDAISFYFLWKTLLYWSDSLSLNFLKWHQMAIGWAHEMSTACTCQWIAAFWWVRAHWEGCLRHPALTVSSMCCTITSWCY